jgi:small subunit ribosomal protein S8
VSGRPAGKDAAMSMTDPISDMLTRIRNAQTARKPSVTLPSSKQKLAVAKVLEQEGYLASVSTENVEGKDTLTLELKYYQDKPVIERIERVSRPGLRIFKRVDQLPVVQGGLGVAIVSTSQGVMTNVQAKAQGHGGEVLCIVL